MIIRVRCPVSPHRQLYGDFRTATMLDLERMCIHSAEIHQFSGFPARQFPQRVFFAAFFDYDSTRFSG